MMEKSVRSKAELKALSDTLTIRERYALDAYLQNKNDVGVRELVFEMTLTDRMIVSNAALRTRTKEFFKRNDVLAYIELKGIEEKERTMLIDSVDDDSRVKTYEEIIRELETERRRAKLDNNEENYIKYTDLILKYKKASKEDSVTDEPVRYYVPLVCVDNCPLYKREQDRINKQKQEENGKEDESF